MARSRIAGGAAMRPERVIAERSKFANDSG
jgi:hypothetical protein